MNLPARHGLVPAVSHVVRTGSGGAAGWLMRWMLLLAVGLACALGARAQQVQEVPALSGRVIDTTGTLDAVQKASLDARLAALEAKKGSQVVVLLVPTTLPEDIASYANRVANTWKIGRRDVGDGVLLIVAKNDRALRIEVAKTLEGALPDLAAKRIIDQAIMPLFRQGDYAGGLNAGVDQMAARIAGEALPAVDTAAHGIGKPDFQWFDLLIFMVFALPVAAAIARSVFGRKVGALLTGFGVGGIAMVLTASLLVAGLAGVAALVYALVAGFSVPGKGRGWGAGGTGFGTGGGGWGGGGGGGGFSSGGGGDFGGGGASGNW